MNLEIPNEEGRGVARYLDMEVREVTEGEGPVRLLGTAHPSPTVLDESGRMHMGVLGTMCDAIGGFCGGLGALPDGWVVTTNMMLRSADRPVGAVISLESEVLRAGRTAVVTNVHAHDDHGFVVGGIVRSAVLVPEGGPPPFARPARLDLAGRGEQFLPFDTWLDARPLAGDTEAGVEIELRDDFRNPWGIMHGGVTSAVIDAAARHVLGNSFHVDDVVIHFVAPARVGPVVAYVTVLGTRPDGTVVRVAVHDRGSDDRTVAFAVATVSSRG
ncbi:MAG TPA: acyl-CoA thioesterase domain-containing protein [Acidimicrobiia bacterium]